MVNEDKFMADESPQFSISIAASKHIAGRIKKTMGIRTDTTVHSTSVHSLTSRSLKNHPPHLLIYEHKVNDGERSFRIIEDIVSVNPHPAVFIVTELPDHAEAVQFLKSGADMYLALPAEQSKMYELMEKKIDEWQVQQTRKSYRHDRKKSYDFHNIVGASKQLQSVIARSRKLLTNPKITVLIQGETGTGKELMAKAIHYNSVNADQPFVEIACSSIPESLLESELFGHEKGAFTDAKNEKIGLFELAGKGTIFLDEIGDISPVIQSKLLNVLEEKKVRRLGGIVDIPVQARVITATSRNLQEMVRNGAMRKDLYYRLAVFSLELPPLRDRGGDIPHLAKHFLHDFAKENEKQIDGFTSTALEKLIHHRWEGNVRELKHVIERAVLLSSNERLDEDDLELISPSAEHSRDSMEPTGSGFVPEAGENAITISLALTNASFSQVEKELVREVLRQTGGNKKKASEILKISRPRLDRLIHTDPEFFKSLSS